MLIKRLVYWIDGRVNLVVIPDSTVLEARMLGRWLLMLYFGCGTIRM